MADDEEGIYELVMPFVMTTDNGGPHDPAAFVSGYRLGHLDAALGLAKAVALLEPERFVAPPDEHQQIDLIAMYHGYTTEVEPHSDDWSIYSFVPADTEVAPDGS